MDRRWQITPKLCGTNWARAFFIFGACQLVAVCAELLLGTRRELISNFVAALVVVLVDTQFAYEKLRYVLHVAPDYLGVHYAGEVEIIRKYNIRKLRESSRFDPRGNGLVVYGTERFLRGRTQIFIPRALPEFELIRQTIAMWLEQARVESGESVPISPRGIPYS